MLNSYFKSDSNFNGSSDCHSNSHRKIILILRYRKPWAYCIPFPIPDHIALVKHLIQDSCCYVCSSCSNKSCSLFGILDIAWHHECLCSHSIHGTIVRWYPFHKSDCQCENISKYHTTYKSSKQEGELTSSSWRIKCCAFTLTSWGVLQSEILIPEIIAINALPTSAVRCGEVPTLCGRLTIMHKAVRVLPISNGSICTAQHWLWCEDNT